MRDNVKLKITVWDIVLCCVILILCALLWVVTSFSKNNSSVITVEVNGQVFGTYTLNEDRLIDINGHNRLKIEDGRAFMEWADCPDKLCVKQMAVSEKGGSVICLPNRVSVTLSSGELDAVAGE